MLEFCSLYGYVAAGLVGLSCGALGARLGHSGLVRKCRELEYAVNDFEVRLIREVKLRAANAGVKARKEDDELIEKVLAAKPPQPEQPWWVQFVDPSLKK